MHRINYQQKQYQGFNNSLKSQLRGKEDSYINVIFGHYETKKV